MKTFASGKFALQICDRCGRRVKYGELRNQVVNLRPTDLMVCDECLDQDHPQLQVGRIRVDDPQSLRDQKSEDYELSRGEFGWRPVGPVLFALQVGQVMG